MGVKSQAPEVSTNILMTRDDKAKLLRLCSQSGLKMSPQVRKMIRSAYGHAFENDLRCADSASCRCSQLHSVRSPIDPLPDTG